MRIGLFSSIGSAHYGGRYTFKQSILNELSRRLTNGKIRIDGREHEFIVFTRESNPTPLHKKLPTIILNDVPIKRLILNSLINRNLQELPKLALLWLEIQRRPRLLRLHALTQASAEHKIDMIWFLGGFEPVRVPYVFTLFDLQHRLQPHLLSEPSEGWTLADREVFYRLALPSAMRIIVGTPTGKEEALRMYNLDPKLIHVIPMPANVVLNEEANSEQLTSNAHIPTDPYIFYPAGYWIHKNHRTLINTLIRLRDDHGIRLRLVCCGADMGDLENLRRIVSREKLESQVELRGFIPEQELADLYRNAVALVFPTLFGPDNLPPLEAFAYGCPVIASAVSGSEEQLGDAAILFPPTDVAALTQAILKVTQDSQIRASLVAAGYNQLKGRTVKDYVDAMFSTLAELESQL